MKAIKGIGIAVLVLMIVVLAVSVFLPSEIHVERSKVMKASPAAVFSQINDLKEWRNWNPWSKQDANIKITYEGPEKGKGAKYSWKSDNNEVGKGSLFITESIPDQMVATHMDFIDRGSGRGSFKLEPDGMYNTKVTWSMDGDMGNNPIAKLIGLVMKNKLGNTFEEGLTDLERASRKAQHSEPVPEVLNQVPTTSQSE